MATKISDKLVRELAAPATGQAITYDAEIKGFGIRVTRAGAKAFVLNYRVRGAGIERRLTIGQYPAWSVAAAREEAKALRRRVDRGEDPMAARHEERAAPTVAELAERYVEEHLPRKRPGSRRGDLSIIGQHVLPALGRLKVTAVTHADVCDLHRRITRRGQPIRANRVAALLSKMFSLAVRPWGWRSDNPAQGVPRNPENRRERFLSPAEIGKLVEALKAYPGRHAADCILFALLTGCRVGEALSATWAEVDLESGAWTKPAANTKQAKLHRVPLSGPARQLLQKMKPADAKPDDHLFPGRRPGAPLRQLRSCWSAVTEAAGISGARVHDLRHTFASMLASSGSSLPVIGAMLGHTQAATTQRYSHLLDDPLREAADRVGAIVEGGAAAQVVPIRRGR